MTKEIDYAAVLADLEARRAIIDNTIAGIRLLLGQPSLDSGGAGASQDANGTQDPPEDAFVNLAVSPAAKKFLRMIARRPQSTQAICEALKRGGLKSSAKNFYSNVHTALSRDPDFVKVSRGKWGLAEWYPGKRREKKEENSKEDLQDMVVIQGSTELTSEKGKR